jgi:hypothetical protein
MTDDEQTTDEYLAEHRRRARVAEHLQDAAKKGANEAHMLWFCFLVLPVLWILLAKACSGSM